MFPSTKVVHFVICNVAVFKVKGLVLPMKREKEGEGGGEEGHREWNGKRGSSLVSRIPFGKLLSDSEVGKQPFYPGEPQSLSKMALFPEKGSSVHWKLMMAEYRREVV